jgi:hypothetical protein
MKTFSNTNARDLKQAATLVQQTQQQAGPPHSSAAGAICLLS